MFTAPDSVAYVDAALAAARVVDDVPADTLLLPIAKVGIVGAGTMGGGIAMNFANVGINVHIVETQQVALDRGLATIRTNYERSASRGRFSMEEAEERIALIDSSLAMEDLADCDMIIEAVFEDMELKKSIFSRLDGIAKPGWSRRGHRLPFTTPSKAESADWEDSTVRRPVV